jgi:hypothetical protein
MKALLNLLIPLILFQACQEYYTNPDIANGEELIVIEGLITNEPGPYKIKITKTLPYNQSGALSVIPEPVSNVIVTITDNAGTTEQLTENESGIYYTSPEGIRGEPGKIYLLRLVTPEGFTYQSDSCKMAEPAVLDSVYAEPGVLKTLDKNASGAYVETNHYGINLYMDVVPAQGNDYYFKAETVVIKEAWHIEWRQGRPAGPGVPPPSTPVYCWELPPDNNDKNLMSQVASDIKPLKKRTIGFITSDVPSATDDIRDPSSLFGAITTTSIYSMTRRMYEISTQLNTQTNPSNSIFDPIPTRIESNITCVNEPSRIVLGYFNVAALARKSQYFYWTDLSVSKRNLEISAPLPVVESCESDVPPAFWIDPWQTSEIFQQNENR